MRILRLILGVFSLVLASSCAHVVNPDGGAKDTKAPSLVKALPANASTAIMPKDIRLQFDEYVQLLNSDAVIISPPIANTPSIKAKNKSIRIEIKDSLLPNTTYSINFGDAITDITERNPVKNFSYVFSTGSFLDTAFVAGSLKDAFTGKPLKDYLVMLYTDSNDSVPAKRMPYYFTKSDAEGRWRINNIKETQYRLFALKDENSNYLFDQVTENIAFSDTLIIGRGTGSIIPLLAFKSENEKAQLISSKTIAAGIQQFVWSKQLDLTRPSVRVLRCNQPCIVHFSRNNDTAYVFTNSRTRDSVVLELSTKMAKDTIAWELKADEDSSQWQLKFKTSTVLNTQAGSRMNKANTVTQSFLPNQNLTILFNRPVNLSALNTYGVYLVKDSSSLTRIEIDSTMLSEDGLILNLANERFARFADFKLILIPSANRDTLKFNLHRATEEERASLQLHLNKVAPNMIVYLLLNDQIVYRFPATNTDIMLKHIWPGTYKVKCLQDTNGNGVWDTGNYFQHRQAEKISSLPLNIQVKGNWEVVQEIVLPD